jgi:apolipoprotein N-acyltransferase
MPGMSNGAENASGGAAAAETSGLRRVVRLDQALPAVTAVLGGAVFGAGFNLVLLPAPAGWLAPVLALAGLGIFLRGLRTAGSVPRGALLGFLGYLAAGAIGLFWMHCITFPAYLGIALYVALYGAAFGALAVLVRRRVPAAAFPWFAAALWAALEWARAWIITGFPWMLAGSAWAGIPAAMGGADLGGVYLVSFWTVLAPALLVAEKPNRPWVRAAVAGGVTLVFLGYGWVRLDLPRPSPLAPRPSSLRVAAVQPLVPFKVGPEADRDKMLGDQLELARQLEPGSADLLVWSETMVPEDLLEQVGPVLAPLAREKRCFFLAGGVVHEGRDADGEWAGRAWNSAVLVSPEGAVLGRYDKRHLVPFGEFVPVSRSFPGVSYIFDLIGTVFTPGEERPMPAIGDLPLAVNICYEDCFPYLARRDVRRGARLMVNLTNDSWFRQSAEARQHLALAAFRAVETRRPLVRATNTGITASIDADGRITAPPEGGLWKKGLVKMDVPIGPARSTVYAEASDLFVWLCGLVVLGAVLSGVRRRRRQEPRAETDQ